MAEVERLLSTLQQRQVVLPLDAHFARLMCRLDGGGSEALALAAALVSRHAGEGHVCLPLERVGATVPGEAAELEIPPLALWIESLRRSTVVGTPGEYRPLILDEAGRLYLHRYWQHEKRLASALVAWREPAPEVDE
ncbi:MAG TPA: exodeoxyribonuclease V subunit alpha, partial [Kiloniellaceae bacterium]|nr:exodeoxyribonuclease V subunit alpha [Kiloniellaceae bacterium]